MGIFGNDKKEEKKKEVASVKKSDATKDAPKVVKETGIIPGNILKKPHVSEKALLAGTKNVYVFEIYPKATKRDVALAVTEAFNVEVLAVNTVRLPAKKGSNRTKGKAGKKSAIKKAYVTLKEGDRLQLI
ncbi:50S ribosomal protein L23 [Candidatus Wolfebacteria bacterium]|nr:50S ribosomal protein L23 [Candidatus Wolfebacteria bacterium]